MDLTCLDRRVHEEHGLNEQASVRVRVTGHSLGGALAMLQLSSMEVLAWPTVIGAWQI